MALNNSTTDWPAVKTCKSTVRVTTVDGERWRLDFWDETLPDGSSGDELYVECKADSGKGCVEWDISGDQALLVHFKVKGKSGRNIAGAVSMPFGLKVELSH